MKILILNPHWHESPIVRILRSLGVATIVTSDAHECEIVLKLHGGGLTLFVGHDEDGIRLNEFIKTTPRFAHIPVILTLSNWTDQQCVDHQATPFGANAYLQTPIDEKYFFTIIDQILGTELRHGRGVTVSEDLTSLHNELSSVESNDSGDGIALAAPLTSLPEESARSSSQHQESDGISLTADATSMVQVEDAASIYGQPSPESKNASDGGGPQIQISLDEPSIDLGNLSESLSLSSENKEATDGSTQEFKIDLGGEAEEPVASPLLTTPIEADEEGTKLAIMPAEGLRGGDFLEGPIIKDVSTQAMEQEEETHVAFTQVIPDEAYTSELAATPIAPTSASPLSTSPVSNANTGTYTHSNDDLDADALSSMPYLGKSPSFASNPNPLGYREPMDDAVVPGGAANAPDTETLKKYLYLREQDVTALSAQLRQARERVNELEEQLRHEKSVTSEFAHLAQEQDRRINDFEKEKKVALEIAQKENDDLKFEMKRRHEKIRVMELQVKEATEATERLKERVRNDIRKIRSREKELENRLEIMKKDSEALLGAREHKIIDLKRKLDLIEFNTDLLQDQLEKERRTAAALREKLAKAAQIVRVAGGLLTPEEEALLSTGASVSKDEEDRTPAA